MLASYYPKKNKPVLLLTSAHDQPTLDENEKRKAECILLYNEQRCGVDIVNRMLHENKSQPKSDDYRISVFTFLLDLAVINSITILKYNLREAPTRRNFTRKLIHQLTTPWLKRRFELKYLKADTVKALKSCLKECAPEFNTNPPVPVKPAGVPARCYICVDEVRNMATGALRKKLNKNMKKKQRWYCPRCGLAICTKPVHRVVVLSTMEQFCKNCAQNM